MRISWLLLGSLFTVVYPACSSPTRNLGSSVAGSGGTNTPGGSSGSSASSGSPAGGRPGDAGSEQDSAGQAGSALGESGAADLSDAGSDAGGMPDPGAPLMIVAVTPTAATVSTRQLVSVTFSRPVSQASVDAGVSLLDSRGKVTGSLAVSGNVVTFQPRGSLCLAQSYHLTVSHDVHSTDGAALSQASSFDFSIPDGAWGDPTNLDAPGNNGPTFSALDEGGNAVVAWLGDVPELNYYDASAKAWGGRQTPAFGAASSNYNGLAAIAIRNGRSIASFPRFGIVERLLDGTGSVTRDSSVIGVANYAHNQSLALADNGAAIITWDNQDGTDPGNVFAAVQAPATTTWVAPTDTVSGAWSVLATVHPLPDNSFMAVYDKRPAAGTFGNLTARRYKPGTGWLTEHAIVAGATPITAHDNFGNLITMSGNGTSVSSYSFSDDTWTPQPDFPTFVNSRYSIALAGDGTAFVLYTSDDYDNKSFRLLFRRLVGGQWSPEVEFKTSTTDSPAFFNIAADDCGNAVALWEEESSLTADGMSLYARRYTPDKGWAPALFVTTAQAPSAQSMNGRGESLVSFATPGATQDESTPNAIRFQ